MAIQKDLVLLKQLQKIDLERDRLLKNKQEFPLQIKNFKDALGSLQEQLNLQKNKLKELDQKRRNQEMDLKDLERKLQKSQARLAGLTLEGELKAVQKEIAFLRQEKDVLENEILELLLLQDKQKENCGVLEEKLIRQEKEIQRQIHELETSFASLDHEILAQEAQKSEMCSKVNQEIIFKYERIRSKEPLAISEATKEGQCLGCSMGLPPQLYNDLLKQEHLWLCPNCHRILIPCQIA